MNLAEIVVIEKDIVLPMVALAGLLAGVVLGKLLPGRKTAKGRNPRKRSRRSRGGSGSGGGSEVYVGNLPYEMGESELRGIFKAYGKVRSARVIPNRATGGSKGYGFVVMSSESEASASIKDLHSKDVGGRRLVVSSARTSARDRDR
jgi:RNA recognition motif-containing protein